MTALRFLFFAIWFATIAVRLAILWKLGKLRIAHRYPWFTAFLIVSIVETCARMYAGFSGGGRSYNASWATWQWVTLLLMVGLAVECFVLHAKHFQRFCFAGSVTACVLTAVALAAWLPTADIGTLAKPDAPALTKATRDLCTVGYVLVSLTAIAFGLFGEKWIRSNVREHAKVLQWLFFLQACAYFVRGGVLQGQWFGIAAAFLVTGGSLYCFVRWWYALTEEGERWDRPAPQEQRRMIATAGR